MACIDAMLKDYTQVRGWRSPPSFHKIGVRKDSNTTVCTILENCSFKSNLLVLYWLLLYMSPVPGYRGFGITATGIDTGGICIPVLPVLQKGDFSKNFNIKMQ